MPAGLSWECFLFSPRMRGTWVYSTLTGESRVGELERSSNTESLAIPQNAGKWGQSTTGLPWETGGHPCCRNSMHPTDWKVMFHQC